MKFVQNIEDQAQDHGYHAGKDHSCELDISKIQGDSGKTYDKDNRSQNEVSGSAVIHLVVNQHTKSGSSDHTIEQERNSANDRSRDRIDQGGKFAEERTADGNDGCTADHLYTVYFGHCHDADVFAIGCCRHGAETAGNSGREEISKKGTMKSWVFDKVSSNDLAGYDLVSDVLGSYQKESRKDRQDRLYIKFRLLEIRKCKECSFSDGGKIKDATGSGSSISGDDRDQDWNDGQKTAEQDLSKYSHTKCYKEYDDIFHVDLFIEKPGGAGCTSCKLQPDQSHNRSHGSCWKYDVDPVCSTLADDQGNDHAADTKDYETAQGILIAKLGSYKKSRGQKCEAGTEIGRSFAFGDQNEEQCADTVHQ